jgi:hypothetical protein
MCTETVPRVEQSTAVRNPMGILGEHADQGIFKFSVQSIDDQCHGLISNQGEPASLPRGTPAAELEGSRGTSRAILHIRAAATVRCGRARSFNKPGTS